MLMRFDSDNPNSALFSAIAQCGLIAIAFS
jgi:hypothetical protein